MNRKTALKTLRITPLEDLKKRNIKQKAEVALLKNQRLTGYARRWIGYLSLLPSGDAKPKRRPYRAGTNLMENGVMAIDESGRSLSCHFVIQPSTDTPPIRVNGLGFYAPLDRLRSVATRGFFILDESGDDAVGLANLVQSARAVICKKDVADNFFDPDVCQWVRNETPSGLAIKGKR